MRLLRPATLLLQSILFGAVFFANDGVCAPRRDLSLYRPSDGALIHLTLRTEEGLRRFTFRPNSIVSSSGNEAHYAGATRSSPDRPDHSAAALSSLPAGGWIFYTSRRTGRPVALTYTMSATLPPQIARVYRSPSVKIPCGVAAAHNSEEPRLGGANGRRRSRSISPFSSGLRPYSPARVVEVGTDADYEFFRRHGTETNAYIRAVLNATDALYTSSFGIRIKLVSQRVSSGSDPSLSGVSASSLLESFRRSPYAYSSPADLRHLFTGKQLDGLTIGIAYIGAACTAGGRYGVGLSASVSQALQPFLAAHEIAHNLGAVHDNVRNSVMNPAITSDNNRFSEQTKADIREFLSSSGSCISTEPLSEVDLKISPPQSAIFAARTTFRASSTQNCRVVLEGSADGEVFVPLGTRGTRSNTDPAVTTLTFSGPLPPLTTPQTFFFRSRVACGRSRKASLVRSQRYEGTPTNGAASVIGQEWLASLRESLN